MNEKQLIEKTKEFVTKHLKIQSQIAQNLTLLTQNIEIFNDKMDKLIDVLSAIRQEINDVAEKR